MDKITITTPTDYHLHLRQGKMLELVLPYTAMQCEQALVMPNLRPKPVLTADDARGYHEEIIREARGLGFLKFEPLMTIQITPQTAPAIIAQAKKRGITAGKIYPRGLTTNSENGVMEYRLLKPVFAKMQEINIVLCLHGEHPDEQYEGLYKEKAFVEDELFWIAREFPGLRIVLEHITTAYGVRMVQQLAAERAKIPGAARIAGTITLHHLLLTIDDVIGYGPKAGGNMQPHHFCKPVAKHRADRQVLREVAFTGEPNFFLGTDSAPHEVGAKECEFCCAGVFTAPVMLQTLAMLFEKHRSLANLEKFTSKNGAAFYRLPPNKKTITLIKKEWPVPEMVGSVKPFLAGHVLPWSFQT